MITSVGATGALTDYPGRTQDYYYCVMASGAAYEIGSPISMQQPVRKIFGQETATCGFMQLDGPSLSTTADGGYTLTETGVVSGVYYADVSAGGVSYRVYSEPVVLSFSSTEAESDSMSNTSTNWS